MTNTKRIDHTEEQEIRNLLIGRRIMLARDDQLVLDNDLTIQLQGNWGCGGCPNGYYELERLEGHANVITDVKIVTEDIPGNESEHKQAYRLFVYTDTVQTEVATFVGDDGNGYYGSGFFLTIQL